MFPTSKHGNTRVLAFPAISLPGAFFAPTDGTRAASACNSPSIFNSGSSSLARRVASITLSHTSWVALPLVEKLSIATRGSAKPATLLAVCAVHTAICANWLASGIGVTATSPTTRTPFSPYSGFLVISSMAPLTQVIPGAVLIICRAGRRVSPVVLNAPDICPSASPVLMIIHPRYSGFFTNSRACSMVIPFFLRSSASRAAYSSLLGLFSGSIRVALSIFFNPSLSARACTSSGLPIRMMSAMSSLSTMSAAVNVRSSVASGSTIRCLLLLARSIICCTKSIVCSSFF